MKINLIGNLLGSDGYSNHTRQLFNHLYKINPDIKLDVPLTQDYLNHVNDAELEAIKKPNRISDATIAIMTPPQWRIALGDQTKKFIGFCIFEGSSIPKYWLEYLMDRRVNIIFVPSNHTKQAILNTLKKNKDGLDKKDIENIINKIRIVPHGVNINLFKPKRGNK